MPTLSVRFYLMKGVTEGTMIRLNGLKRSNTGYLVNDAKIWSTPFFQFSFDNTHPVVMPEIHFNKDFLKEIRKSSDFVTVMIALPISTAGLDTNFSGYGITFSRSYDSLLIKGESLEKVLRFYKIYLSHGGKMEKFSSENTTLQGLQLELKSANKRADDWRSQFYGKCAELQDLTQQTTQLREELEQAKKKTAWWKLLKW